MPNVTDALWSMMRQPAWTDLDVGKIKERLQRWLDVNCIVGLLKLKAAAT